MFSLPLFYHYQYKYIYTLADFFFAICVMRGEDGEMKTVDPKIVLTTQQG